MSLVCSGPLSGGKVNWSAESSSAAQGYPWVECRFLFLGHFNISRLNHWRGGRPRISSEVRALITRMSQENVLWGAPRIHGELLKLGFDVSQATVSRYMQMT
jgi:hypothetical protein